MLHKKERKDIIEKLLRIGEICQGTDSKGGGEGDNVQPVISVPQSV